jgi:beta-phosphoglucomutase-like phosphatase (HAD superfamily)
MSTLHIFDFDDTLIRAEDKIRITHADGVEELLSSEEFAKYKEQPGDEYDFSDFDRYPTNPTIVENVFAELRAAIALDGPGSVVILTARSNTKPVIDFLKDNNIEGIAIVGTASDNPMRKAQYVLDRVKNGDFVEVRVFEDNARNIRTIKKVIEPTGVRLQTNRVTKKGVVSATNR